MIARLKKHLTPATAIAVIALFVALGGTALASHLTGASIKNNSLTGVDIKDIQSGDIKDDKIQSKDIKNGTIKSEDAEAGAFETAGDRASTSMTTRTGTLTVDALATGGLTVACNSDEIVLSGGWGEPEDIDASNIVSENRRDGNGWRVEVRNFGPGADSITIRAECAKIS